VNVPPPPYAPPPTRSTNGKTWAIVLSLLLFSLLACGGLGFYGFGKVKQMSKQDPKPMAGYGKPRVVKKLKDGWATYALKDLGMEIDFPDAPVPAKIEWTPGQRVVTTAWSYYELDADFTFAEVDATEYILDIAYTREELAESFLESFKTVYPSVTEELRQTTIADLPALKQRLEYKIDGESYITEAYHFLQGKRAMGIRFGYALLLASEAHPEIDRILKSVRFKK
jgi:hypothetical protein